ncbi:hypothetical protein VNI00_003678 [Paramarasmius palmivorus]|uniref:Hydrophobin n=1 Tax=Paramarasmius palmivorus TaxID=297713 RepID=A0AAW0DTP5_9AGAR
MMYKVLSLAALASLASLAAAMPLGGGPTSQCDVGELQCCDNMAKAGDPKAKKLIDLLQIVVQDVNVPVGLNCDPITGIGVSGTSCAAQPVCCEDNNFNGVIALGCSPINVNV